MQKPKPEKKFVEQKYFKIQPGQKLTFATKKKSRFYDMPQSDIYDAIEKNLIEDGCFTAAKYFKELVQTENELIKSNSGLKKRVRDFHCLLFTVMENIKSAENTFRTLGEKELTLRLLIKSVHTIQAQDESYVWLVRDLYKIILNLTRTWDDSCIETLSRVRYEYGVVLADNGEENLDESIVQLSKSLETCKGTMWYANETDRSILNEEVSRKLGDTLLRKAKIDCKTDSKSSSQLAERAAAILAEMRTRDGPNLYCAAKLRQCEYIIASGEYEMAIEILKDLKKHIMTTDDQTNECEFYFWLGVCHFNLSNENIGLALKNFNLSLPLSEENNLKAETLLYLGKIQAKNSATHGEARQCLIEAKDLFHRLKDFKNEKIARFLMAQLRANQLYPTYLQLIQKAGTDNFCYFFDLLQWKQKLLPFWNEAGEIKCHQDDVRCILDEHLETENAFGLME